MVTLDCGSDRVLSVGGTSDPPYNTGVCDNGKHQRPHPNGGRQDLGFGHHVPSGVTMRDRDGGRVARAGDPAIWAGNAHPGQQCPVV